MPEDGELTLLVDGQRLSGWQDIRVTRGIERCPSDFDIAVTERFPGEAAAVFAEPGAPCVVQIGKDTVVTGFVDRYTPSITGQSHNVRISGRGKCQDLVDCSAYLRGAANQINGATTRQIAERLCDPFGITVTAPDGDGRIVPQFNVILTETCWDIIERVTRYSGLLAYEGADGNLILSRVGTERMASGFLEGANVERASVSYSMDQRFSLYEALIMPIENLADVAKAANGPNDFNTRGRTKDPTVRRFRPHVFVSEQVQDGVDIGQLRCDWEKNRRNGRSHAISITTDSWRDQAGRLWEPNTKVSVHVPSCKVSRKDWVISEVTYSRGAEGTHAELVLMDESAFSPEPIVLSPWDVQTWRSMQGTTGTAPTNPRRGDGPGQ